MVSSVTPLMPAAISVQRVVLVRERAAQHVEDDGVLLGVARRRSTARRRRARTRGPCARAAWRRRRRRGSCSGRRRRASAAPARCTTSTPRASRPSRRRPARRRARRRCRRADGDRGGGVVLGREDVAGGPAHLGAERDQGLDEDGGLHGHVQRAGDPGAGRAAWLGRTRARMAMRPGISCSARRISLRPNSARREVGDLEVGRSCGSPFDRPQGGRSAVDVTRPRWSDRLLTRDQSRAGQVQCARRSSRGRTGRR